MTRTARLLALVSILLVFPTGAFGQPPSPLTFASELVLTDGSRLYGAIVSEDADHVVFRTTSGALITTPRNRVAAIRPVVGRLRKGEFRREDPNDTRLLFAPTGRALPRGQVYLGVYQFSIPFVQVGLTDRISFGGGTPLLFGFDEAERPFWITPKVQLLSRSGLHVATGVFHGFNGRGDGLGVAYAVVTKEGETGAVTAGAGMSYTAEGHRGAVAMLGADAPLRRNMKLVTENYAWNSGAIVSLGVRFFGENLSADLALGVVFLSDGVFGAPVANFVYRF